jgi:hypothetical protein
VNRFRYRLVALLYLVASLIGSLTQPAQARIAVALVEMLATPEQLLVDDAGRPASAAPVASPLFALWPAYPDGAELARSQACRQPQHLLLAPHTEWHHVGQGRFARRHSAGLVERYVGQPADAAVFDFKRARHLPLTRSPRTHRSPSTHRGRVLGLNYAGMWSSVPSACQA